MTRNNRLQTFFSDSRVQFPAGNYSRDICYQWEERACSSAGKFISSWVVNRIIAFLARRVVLVSPKRLASSYEDVLLFVINGVEENFVLKIDDSFSLRYFNLYFI